MDKRFQENKGWTSNIFCNEFFDAIPIQQFKKNKGKLYKKYFSIQNNKLKKFLKKPQKMKPQHS